MTVLVFWWMLKSAVRRGTRWATTFSLFNSLFQHLQRCTFTIFSSQYWIVL